MSYMLFDHLCGYVLRLFVLILWPRNTAYKKLLEYLFWVWDPEMPGGSMEPARVPEEGFLDAETYKVQGNTLIHLLFYWGCKRTKPVKGDWSELC